MELKVGQKASRTKTITLENAEIVAQLTGNYNPLHFNKEIVSQTRFKRPIVQGGLTTGLLHAFVAMDMPGPGTVFLSQDWKYTAPVFIGDTIAAEVELLEIHTTKPVTKLGIRVTRDGDETVLEGEA